MSLLVTLADLPVHEGDSEKINAAIRILRVIMRIDFELLGPLLQDVLTKLLMVCRNAILHDRSTQTYLTVDLSVPANELQYTFARDPRFLL